MPAIVRPTLTYLAEFGVRDGSTNIRTQGNTEVNATRKFIGLWSERLNIAKYFLGTSEIEWDGAGPVGGNPVRLRRLVPLPYSDDQNAVAPAWYARRITVDHNHAVRGATLIVGDGSKAATYKKVVFTVHYEKPKFYVADDVATAADEEFNRWTEWPKGRAEADVLTFKAGAMTYQNSGGSGAANKTTPYGANRVMPLTRIPFIWRELPPGIISLFQGTPIPWQLRLMGDGVVEPYVGTINKTKIGYFNPGTLYLKDWEWDETPSPVDDPAWSLGIRYDVTFNMIHKPTPGGWNWTFYSDPKGVNSGFYFNSRNLTYYGPGTVPDYKSLYNEREFKNLWKVQL